MSAKPAELTARTAVQYLKGVGPVRAQALRRLGIERIEDLARHYPVEHVHRAAMVPLAGLRPGDKVVTRGRVLDVQTPRSRRGRAMVVAMLGDGPARLRLTWFNAPYMASRLRVGRELVASGEVSAWSGRVQMVNPAVEDPAESDELVDERPRPRYPLTAGVSQVAMRRLVERALEVVLPSITDPLPVALLEQTGLMGLRDALARLHRPDELSQVESARERLAFDEAFALQLAVGVRRGRLLRRGTVCRLVEHDGRSTRYVEELGFRLTGAQRRVLAAIARDLRGDCAMHRLLQGDVGSGKTVVAVIASIFAIEAGGQVAFMAPTEVLARQHARRQVPRLDAVGVRAEVLTGSSPAPERRRVLAGLADGSVDLVFGTHALIQEEVRFARLGFAVVDEQHRFGVLQRASLASDGAHLLVMSATPIPRSLALTVYGDLDLSVLDERPPGRTPVRTEVVPMSALDPVLAEVRRRSERGERCFLVYPLVEESEKQDLQSAQSAFEDLRRGPLSGLPVGLLHGRMRAEEKEDVARAFADGVLRVLVATTVIEVGVDVAEASLMVVHHAERFGLAQLHQLRGRVGRGALPSRCVLALGEEASRAARERLLALAGTDDGFEVAELDLAERGMGDLHGLRQHGELPFRVLQPLRHGHLVELAREHARQVLDGDPRLEAPANRPLRGWLESMAERHPVWSLAG